MQIKFMFPPSSGRPAGVGQRLLAFIFLVVVAVLALMFSLVLLPFVVAGAAWLWWRTRAVRRQLREMQAHMQRMQEYAQRDEAAGGEVIEGEVIREHRADRFIER
jgi:Flp pilus assembly protein TadB